ncbi:MAG: hypothetical protein HRU25_08240 [Psychrobium sp.]|nr:hypothetical protein [Psychrobium sp.]
MFEKTAVSDEFRFYNMTTKQWLAFNQHGEIGLSPKKTAGEISTTLKVNRVDNTNFVNFIAPKNRPPIFVI